MIIFWTFALPSPAFSSKKHHVSAKAENKAATEQNVPRYDPDLSLLNELTEEGQNSEKCRYPFVGVYTDGARSLRFVASEHSVGPNSISAKLLKKTLDSNKPDLLILEGFPSNLGHSPEGLKRYAMDCIARDPSRCNEIQFAIAYAVEHRIPFIGGEPPDEDIHKKLREKKYSERDIAAYFWLRQISQMTRENQLDKKNYSQEMREFFKHGSAGALSISEADFNIWYKSHYKRDFKMMEVTSDFCRPDRGPNATLAQKIAYDEGVVRDEHILRTTARALREYKNVTIQYGTGHHLQQRRVLSKMLPSFSCKQ